MAILKPAPNFFQISVLLGVSLCELVGGSSSTIQHNHLVRWEGFLLPSRLSLPFSQYRTETEHAQDVAARSLSTLTGHITHINVFPVFQFQSGMRWTLFATWAWGKRLEYRARQLVLLPSKGQMGACFKHGISRCATSISCCLISSSMERPSGTLLTYLWLFLNHLLSQFHHAYFRINC